MKLLVVVSLALLASVTGQGISRPGSEPQQEAFTRVERLGEESARSFFIFSTSKRNYIIRHDGMGEVASPTGMRRVFNLKIGPGGRLDRLYFLEHGGDLFLLYEVNDRQSGWGYLLRMDQEKRKPKWLTPIRSTNIGQCLVDGEDAYFAAGNLLARIDLRSGKYVWQRSEIDRDYPPAFVEFQLPIIKGDLVIFSEEANNGRSIEVKKTDGRVAQVLRGV